MKRIKVLALTFLTAFLFLLFHVRGHGPGIVQSRRPLCISQISLVNYACARVPRVPPKLPTSQPSDTIIFPEDNNEHRGGNGHRLGRGHEPEHRHGQGHGHRHRHRHGDEPRIEDEHPASPAEENCCRWLKNVDDACVCDLLVHLPSFIAKPAHDYSVIVGETCKVTYHCGGRIY